MTGTETASLPATVFAFGVIHRNEHVTSTCSVHASIERAIAAAGRDADRVIAEWEASIERGDPRDPARIQRLRDGLPDLRFHRERLGHEVNWHPNKFTDRAGRTHLGYDCDWLRYEIVEMPLD